MIALKILLAVLLVLFLLGLIRIGGEGEYSSEGFWVKVRLAWLEFQVFPAKKKGKSSKGDKTPKKDLKPGKKGVKEGSKKGGGLALVKLALPIVGEAVGGLKRRIRIDRLDISYTVAGASDAAGAVMAYGNASAVIGAILPFFEQNFQLKDYHIHTEVDFEEKAPILYLHFVFSGRIGSILLLVVRLGWKFLMNYMKNRPKTPKAENPESVSAPGTKNQEKGDKNG